MNRLIAVALAVAALASPAAAQSTTSAYWRHEEGANGGLIPAGPDTVLDSSGLGNHMQTFNPAFTSATYTTDVSPVPLRSGLPNTLSLDFGPGGDDAGRNDDNFTDNKPINNQNFEALTVELAYSMNAILNGPGNYQALVGKDGRPLNNDPPGEGNSDVPPFKVLVRADDFPNAIPNQLFIEWIDGDGDVHFLAGGQTETVGDWKHVAFTLTANEAQLWVAGEQTPYQLLASKTDDFAGASGVLYPDNRGWSIGRGMFNNGVTDWAEAKIDEVRISNTLLSPDEFLFAAVPEPATMSLVAVGLLAACGLRRRCVSG